MKILVAIKRVVDPYVKIKIKADGSGIDTDNVKMAINPFDEIAIEQAVQFKEQGLASEVVLVSIGDDKTGESLRAGLALGADRAIHVKQDMPLSSLTIANVLKSIVEQETPTLIFLGKQAIDNDNNQVGQMLAGMLGYPQATFASKISLEGQKAIVTREVDGGLQTIAVQLPAVITTDLRLNTPRYATLPNIMKAKAKPLTVIPFASLSIPISNHITCLAVTAPAARKAGKRVQTVTELVALLRTEAKVIE